MKYPCPFGGTSFYPRIQVSQVLELQYFLARILYISPIDSDNILYPEAAIYLNLYKKEVKEKIEARENKKNNMVDLKTMIGE